MKKISNIKSILNEIIWDQTLKQAVGINALYFNTAF